MVLTSLTIMLSMTMINNAEMQVLCILQLMLNSMVKRRERFV